MAAGDGDDLEPLAERATVGVDVLETVGEERATWLGHSFGGRVVAELAAAGPELVERADGRFRYRYCQSTVVSLYGELCAPPPPPETLRAPALLLYADQFGLVRAEQVESYRAALGDLLEVVTVPGGHMVYWDAYEQTSDALEAFLGVGRGR